ncbi:hypothetical protein [Francisella philomiragia]|uniref:hypothetical protein n=1 Tax=Francisella philomiragia TaxID=28110 RepID=UPI0001AF7B0A|nr:hypothetical protein [Francisella philomiragia]
MRVVEVKNYAIAFSFLNLMTMFGGMAMQPISGYIIDLFGNGDSSGYHLLIAIFALLSIICILISVLGIKLSLHQQAKCRKKMC